MQTAFTVSIEAREGITTGISAADRARTIQVAIDPKATRADLATPGHIFPLLARDGGVLVRAGHTEAAVDIARLAGLNPSGVVCEIMNDDGTMARLPDLVGFAQRHGLKVATIADLISYRLSRDRLVERDIATTLHTRFAGDFRLQVYTNVLTGVEHLALVKGDLETPEPVLVRVHALNVLEDVLGQDIDGRGAQLRSVDGGDPRGRPRRPGADPRAVADQHLGSHQGRSRAASAGGRTRRPAAARLRHRRADPEGPRRPRHDPSVEHRAPDRRASKAMA